MLTLVRHLALPMLDAPLSRDLGRPAALGSTPPLPPVRARSSVLQKDLSLQMTQGSGLGNMLIHLITTRHWRETSLHAPSPPQGLCERSAVLFGLMCFKRHVNA